MQIVCAKKYACFSIFCTRCCRTARHFFWCLLCRDDKLQMVPSNLLAYDARFSVCNKRYTMYFEVQSQDIITRHFVTSPFKSMCFQIFWQRLLLQNNRSYSRKKVPNERKLIYAIYNLIVASWCLLFSYGSHLNTTTNLNGIFFGDVYLAPINIVIF